MKKKSQFLLPKTLEEVTNGGIYQQRVRCGKDNCHCRSGDLHEGYYYFIRRVGGRLRKTYVPPNLVERLKALVGNSRRVRQVERSVLAANRKLFSEMSKKLRDLR